MTDLDTFTFADWQQQSGHVITSARQIRAVKRLFDVGADGLTSREIALLEDSANVSGVNRWGGPLTVLRQKGLIRALAEKRQGHHVYVMPEFVQGRETWAGYQHAGGHCSTCTCGSEA